MPNGEIRILVVDDESAIRNVLRISLASHGYKIAEAESGKGGLEKASEFHPHLIILDLGLPDISGYEVVKELRRWTQVPILVLTVDDDEISKVNLLDAGADDYLTKPFGTPELLARIRVGLRNRGMIEATPMFKSGTLEVDINSRKVIRNGQNVKLTNTEFEVLARLIRDRGKFVSQALLLKQIWGSTAEDQSHYLRIYVNQLRKKIEENPAEPVHILTEPGVGYKIV
ncbi:MAG: response regulator [Bdellovibrio sp.]|nr:response regulator [Bdellovibrio sp.]